MRVLLSIKPDFVNEIIKGNKKYEYRKKIFRKDVNSIVTVSYTHLDVYKRQGHQLDP